MPAPATTDSFQGHEDEIVFVVRGTTGRTSGPGCTADPKRLNVMLTRHRCGLLVVGDFYIIGNRHRHMKGKTAKGMSQARGAKIVAIDTEGSTTWRNAAGLMDVRGFMLDFGRYATVPVQK
ncbi:hypothetical protein LLEC1_04644 [Akanthomyces lecanii]|uniref:DNA2/NAM7 helicase-like C-terminal domain-containing protein n=1 Tax=Cordyceps confragosa TaxID=2714763 RepID=A0A179IJL9_CORDF|nr:hypothetical protein LLEC1_04644 [Akanthomyces lecanii]